MARVGYARALLSVNYAAGNFIVVGSTGVVLSSANATTWNAQSSGTSSTLRGISYLNGQFIAIGDAGVVLSSTNGLSWTSLPILNGVTAYSIAAY